MSEALEPNLDEPIVFTHPAFSYLSPKIVLKRLPYGIGMFAAEVINKDELLIGWAGRVVHLKDVLALSDDERGHILQIDDYLFQIPFWPEYVSSCLSFPILSSCKGVGFWLSSKRRACPTGCVFSDPMDRCDVKTG